MHPLSAGIRAAAHRKDELQGLVLATDLEKGRKFGTDMILAWEKFHMVLSFSA